MRNTSSTTSTGFRRPPGPRQRVLHYLGRYVHRTALTDKSLMACDDKAVSFASRDRRDQQRKRMTLPAQEFVRRFLQHVPA